MVVIEQVYATVKSHSQPPVSLVGQLLWREFFYLVSLEVVASISNHHSRFIWRESPIDFDSWIHHASAAMGSRILTGWKAMLYVHIGCHYLPSDVSCFGCS